MLHNPDSKRYDAMSYRRCGRSGLELPALSLGLWHNFGETDDQATARDMILRSFDLGITHFDLANNYGPPPGSAESTFGRVLREDLSAHRDEIVVSTKAGYGMWPGPYGNWGSRKYLLASLDQSLRRMGVDYVDIFYSHRFDRNTPLEETMGALAQAVKSGKALYVGVSSYRSEATREAARILEGLGVPLLIHQPCYHMFDRWIEEDKLPDVLNETGSGAIAFCPLAQGILTGRYLHQIPRDSRVAKPHGYLRQDALTKERIAKVRALDALAASRGQSLAQMAIAWVLRLPGMTSALIGASRVSQIEENVKAVENLDFAPEELGKIEAILQSV